MLCKVDLIKAVILLAMTPAFAADDVATTGNFIAIKKTPAPQAPVDIVSSKIPVTGVVPAAPTAEAIESPAVPSVVNVSPPAQAEPAQTAPVQPAPPQAAPAPITPVQAAPAAPVQAAKPAQAEQPPRPPMPIPPPVAEKPKPARECAKNVAEFKKSPMLVKVLGKNYDGFTRWKGTSGTEILPDPKKKDSMYIKIGGIGKAFMDDKPFPMEICVDANKPKVAYMMSYGVRREGVRHDFDDPKGNTITLSNHLGSDTFTRSETGK